MPPLTPTITEESTSIYQTELRDQNNVLVPALDSLILTFCTSKTQAPINGRTNQNILNLNNVTFVSGLITWNMQEADNAIVVGPDKGIFESHLATFDAKWNSGAARLTWIVEFLVEDLTKI